MTGFLLALAFSSTLTLAQDSDNPHTGTAAAAAAQSATAPLSEAPPPAPVEEQQQPPSPPLPETSVEDAPPPSVFDRNEGESLVTRLTKPFNYDREGKRDPFRLPAAKATPLQPGALFGPFLPLQEIKLENVTVKGIVLDAVNPKALISLKGEEKKTEMLRISVGDYLGEDFGVVQAIRDGQVIIVQTFGEGNKKSTTTRTLYIRK